jgi:riboflavin kinase/FMN adenylyltransferase
MSISVELAKIKPQKETLFTIGVFDGVHIGHRHLLTHLRDKARKNGWLSGVITFKSHPETMLNSRRRLPWLSDLDNRINQIESLGIDIVVTLSFTSELRHLSALEFMQLLKKYLKIQGLVIGPDFALGKDRQGNADQLNSLGQKMGFSIEVVPPLVINGEVVSSSLIRQTLDQGDIKKATKLLGRPFNISGKVVPGDQRGRVLGFPTANLEIKPDHASPGDGVYVTIAYTNDEPLPAVTNIGVRPTFGGGERLIETFIIDHEAQLTGKRFRVEFMDKLREEKCFNSAEELKAQIGKDVEQAKVILSKLVPKK